MASAALTRSRGHGIGASLSTAITVAALSTLSCQAEISGAAGVSGGGMPAMPGPGPTTDPLPATCTSPAPGPSPLRRLTHREYDNTIRDLLGDDTRLAAQFSREEVFLGFDNNASARGTTALLAEQYWHAAETLAARAAADLQKLTGCDADDAAGRDTCADAFIDRFGARAYRRPLEAADQTRLRGLYRSANTAWGFGKAIELVVQTVLQSPHFLYRVEFGTGAATNGIKQLRPYELATRLSYLLWGSAPDQPLLDAAAQSALGSKQQVAAQARRLLADERSRYVLTDFHRQWLGLELINDFESTLDGFSDDLRPLLREETTQFIAAVLWQEDAKLSTLLTAPFSFMNARLASFYGMAGPNGEAFQRVALEPQRGAGIFTQGGILAAHSHAAKTSPVLRGKFVREQFLCNPPPPPPVGIDFTVADKDTTLSVREQAAIHRADPGCAACHKFMDPIGLGFESFDAVGRYRTLEAGKAIDSSGELFATDVDGAFDGPTQLAQKLASSQQVSSCFARQWFRYAYARDEAQDVDACSIATLETSLKDSGGNIPELLFTLTQTDAFMYRTVAEGEKP